MRTLRSDSHCSEGWTTLYILLNPSPALALICALVGWHGYVRAMLDSYASISDSPWTMSSAMVLPAPGPSLIQIAAADHRPGTSAVSPSRGIPSCVTESTPLIAYFTPTVSSPT